jgi:Rrf2 family protein
MRLEVGVRIIGPASMLGGRSTRTPEEILDKCRNCPYGYICIGDSFRKYMISRTSEYALQAMIHLARHVDDWPIPGRSIADVTGVPRKYLAAILGELVRAGVLESSPGMGGGFRLAKSAKEIRLIDVLHSFEPILANRRPCPFGKEICSDDDPCAGHEEWKRVRETYQRFLEKNSVHDVAFMRKKRRGSASPRREKR